MGQRRRLGVWKLGAVALLAAVAGCPGDTEIAREPATGSGNSGPGAASGGSGESGTGGTAQAGSDAGRGGNAGSTGGSAGTQSGGNNGGAGTGTAGSSGGVGGGNPGGASGGGASADAGMAGSSGAGSGGNGGSGGVSVLDKCLVSGCSNTVCADTEVGPQITTCEWREEYACYQNAKCERQDDGQCGWTQTTELQACLGGSGGGLRWYVSCGTPVCIAGDEPFDDASIPNCTSEKAGASCSNDGARCDGVESCGATLICAASDPQSGIGGCPRSRARYKQDVHYLDAPALQQYHQQIVDMPLASYRYTRAPEGPDQLGFIIDDIEPSAAASGDHVNMYGYLSMAVAAIKVQQAQIDALERELAELRSRTAASEPAASEPAPICAP